MKFFKKYAGGIVLSLFEVLVGVLLLINPNGFTAGIIVAAGIVLIGGGLLQIVKYFRSPAETARTEQFMTKGLAAVLVGGFCVWKSKWIVATFPVLTVIYGIVILVAGLSKIQKTVDMLRTKQKKWFLSALSALISLVGAVIILKSPFASTAVLWVFTGTVLIVEAVFDLVSKLTDGDENQTAKE